ncbi:MAG: helix-turn-helix domain-containing protein [Nitratireductor sp.]|uniref:XRE family transcriptional regulator n=1 Tax=Nitratireductor sp. TaxID=1872084 RepID=UPI0026265A25|nr:S24 family peptidase [Nitratireductor sp.]MCV0348489.1 helix-turn-helix domain-containing protein [Nitratireductor sp.]
MAVAQFCQLANNRMMANQVRKIRKSREVTLEHLAELTGISTSYLSRIEAGSRGLSLENAVKIARALKVEPEEISNEFAPEDLERAKDIPSASGKKRGDIPNFTIHAGMGPGGALSVLANDNGEVYSDFSDGFWSFPDAVKAGWRNMSKIYAIPVTGDSMEPTLPGGSFAFIDTSHVMPSPEDIYALDYGDGLMIKRVKLVPRTDKILIISDNERYGQDELLREEVRVYGRVVAWFQWRG